MIDTKILYALDTLSFSSLNEVAAFANISKQNVSYRISKLAQMDVLKGYSVELNLSKLGIVLGRLYLKFSGSRAKNTRRLLNILSRRSLYLWSASGEFDVFLAFDVLRDGKSISSLLTEEFAGNILRSRFSVFSDVLSLDRGYLVEKPPSKSWHFINLSEKPVSLTKNKQKVLSCLLTNPDAIAFPLSVTQISNATQLDFRTVKDALAALKKQEVVQRIRPIINLRALGINHYKLEVHLSAKTDPQARSKMEREIYWSNGSVYINKTIGGEPIIEGEFETTPEKFDLFVEKLEEKYSDQIQEIKHITYREQLITTNFMSSTATA